MRKELQEQLAQFVNGDISLADFKNWFMPASVNAHRLSEHEGRNLVGEVLLRLAEHAQGHCSEEDLRQLFSPLVPFLLKKSVSSNTQNAILSKAAFLGWSERPNSEPASNASYDRDDDLIAV